MESERKRPWWFPELCDDAYYTRLRREYEDAADMTDDELLSHFNDGRRYVCTWDHVGDAYGEWEPLADAFLARVEAVERAREALTRMLDAVNPEDGVVAAPRMSDVVEARSALSLLRPEADTEGGAGDA